VLVFHGIGGIGKTTLSRKLEAALASAEHRPAQWGEPAWPAGSRILPVRIDLALPLYLDLAVMRFLELRRTGRTPAPADFEHDFGALIARTLADLTPDERHLLRSIALLDAFDLDLATKSAGLTQQAASIDPLREATDAAYTLNQVTQGLGGCPESRADQRPLVESPAGVGQDWGPIGRGRERGAPVFAAANIPSRRSIGLRESGAGGSVVR
jgi:hypothetical protein